jgi:hypothetical protein
MTSMLRRFARRMTAAAVPALGLTAALALVGCSQDRHVFRSTSIQPKSVSIVEVETNNTLWSKDVPAGQQLLIDFSRGGRGFEEYSSPDVPADKMKWELWTNDAVPRYGSHMKGGKRLAGDTVDLPGQQVMIKVDILDPNLATP